MHHNNGLDLRNPLSFQSLQFFTRIAYNNLTGTSFLLSVNENKLFVSGSLSNLLKH